MKKLIIVLFTIHLLCCNTQKSILIAPDNELQLEPGKCYFSLMENKRTGDTEQEKSFVLELFSPKFKDTIVKYNEYELNNFKWDGNKYRLEMKPQHNEFVFINDKLKDFTAKKEPIGFAYCLTEIPAQYKVFTKQELLIKNNNVVQKRLLKGARITKRYVRKKPPKLKGSQCYYDSGYWSELKEAHGKEHEGSLSILEVKLKLIDLGYILSKDNIIDEETKKALLDFQRKNGLKEGQIDHETLKKLGINH